MWLHNRVALGLDILNLVYSEVPGMYLCVYRMLLPLLLLLLLLCVFLTAVVAAAAAGWRLLLPFIMVCRMAKFVAGSLDLIPAFSLSSFKQDLFLNVPLERAVAFTPSICLHQSSIGNYGYARSQGGRQAAMAKPHLYLYFFVLLSPQTHIRQTSQSAPWYHFGRKYDDIL